ncbi:pyridoxal-phosphate dependent enzyme, partial [Paenibacillus sp. IB182496]
GGLCAGVDRGFAELAARGLLRAAPELAVVQAEGCSNIARAWREGLERPAPGDSTTQISGLQVPNPPDGERVLEALRGGGWCERVADEDTWRWQERLAAQEGLWVEPAAAIGLGGLEQAVRRGQIGAEDTVVCLLTGAGYKDERRTAELLRARPVPQVAPISELEQEQQRPGQGQEQGQGQGQELQHEGLGQRQGQPGRAPSETEGSG